MNFFTVFLLMIAVGFVVYATLNEEKRSDVKVWFAGAVAGVMAFVSEYWGMVTGWFGG